jgi:hypothetical protein
MSGPGSISFVPPRRVALTAVAVLTASALGVLGAPQASSVPDTGCPPPAPVGSVQAGDAVSGMTVSKGTAPEAFTGEVLGVIDDGIAAGVDMIMVELTSDEIDRVGGIWSGMSGSPVYDTADRLVGAVAYGLSWGPSPVAGVTPAAAMYRLLDHAPEAPATTPADITGEDAVPVPQPLARRLVTDGHVSTAEAAGGMERLPLPVSVSGLSKKRRTALAKRLDLAEAGPFRQGPATGTTKATDPIMAGGNLAATMSYGDLTSGGVGTATAVCGDEVVAFGHPAQWSGKSTMSMHGARAVYVQEDPAGAPFKVANFTGPVGRITQDRLAGIHGRYGALPAGARVRSHVWTVDGRSSRVGRTVVTVPDALPDLAAFAHLSNLDRVFDGISDGSARVRMIVQGRRPGGGRFTLDRMDRVASQWDLSFDSIFDSYDQLAAIQYFPRARPRIDSIDVRAAVDDRLRLFTIRGAQVRQHGRWVQVRPGRVFRAPGGRGTLKVRLVLGSHRNLAGTKRVRFDMRMPRSRIGRTATLALSGGNDHGSWSQPKTFAALLRKLDTEIRNDALQGRLGPNAWAKPWRTKRVGAGDVVGGQLRLRVRITR